MSGRGCLKTDISEVQMERITTTIPQAEVDRQLKYCQEIARMNADRGETPLAFVDTYGCQQNEADSERIRGYLRQMGYDFTTDEEQARIIVLNTCAIREHAEQRVLGNLGALVHVKRRHPEQIICLCGCMAQEAHVAEKVRQSFRHVDLVFGPHVLWKFPEFIHTLLTQRGRIFSNADDPGSIAEGIPVVRQDKVKAWVSIMYGCNNFCSYCIVPYVRGRERSRRPEDILAEVRQLAEEGYHDITLLGQNVNSYGRDLYGSPRFAQVLDALDQTGIERLRFATSHPKDLNDEVVGRFATLRSLMPALHLPVQSGSDAVLAAMNRRYTRDHYRALVAKLRDAVPDIALSTDIIVGFPGETAKDFEDTYRLVDEVGYHQVFTFIYSKREGTPAASMDDDTPREVIQQRFDRLVDLVQQRAFEANQRDLGSTVDVLVEGASKRDERLLAGKSPKNQTVHAPAPAGVRAEDLAGSTVRVRVDEAKTWYLAGEIVDGPDAADGR